MTYEHKNFLKKRPKNKKFPFKNSKPRFDSVIYLPKIIFIIFNFYYNLDFKYNQKFYKLKLIKNVQSDSFNKQHSLFGKVFIIFGIFFWEMS